ncbi:MAG: hypothetical protein ABR541_02695 [Candidatus Dormibacteria bacterium]
MVADAVTTVIDPPDVAGFGPNRAAGTALPVRARSGRRRAVVALLLMAPLALGLSAAVGAAVALEQSRQDAGSRFATGDYAGALAIDRELATRSGPLYVLDRQAVSTAAVDADRTVRAWAQLLAQGGHVEQALNLLSTARPPERAVDSNLLRATLLLDGARAAARGGNPLTALRRLDMIRAESLPSAIAQQVAALRSAAELAAVPVLLRSGRAVEALGTLDRVRIGPHAPAQDKLLRQLLPGALLSAGRLAEQRDDHATAALWLSRLVSEAPTSPEARTARDLLGVPQPVTGTLVRRDGAPLIGPVRLAGHFVRSDRGDYATGPYLTAMASSRGDFRIDSVPLGGPYVVQIQRGGAWLTPVDTASGDPAYPVTVTALTPVDLAFVIVPS